MSSVVDHSLVKTEAVEKVVAPISGHLCLLVLLCEDPEEELLVRLEAAAQDVARATDKMAAVASRLMDVMEDEVVRRDMSVLLEPVSVSGQHVLLAAQKLSIQPGLAEHREELISATQNVLLEVVKVLLVDDDATVRKVLRAADRVLDCLSMLASSLDLKSLLNSFRLFSDALLLLNHLTAERASSLQDPRQAEGLLEALEILRRCVPMLHTALCTTLRHPTSEQARSAKTFILDKVESTVQDMAAILQSRCQRGSLSPRGFYTGKRHSLLHLLNSSSSASLRGLDSLVRDIVFHCMMVANCSRSDLQQSVVAHCRIILQYWSDITMVLKVSEEPESFSFHLEHICTSLMQQIHMLDTDLMTAVLYQFLDTFLVALPSFEELQKVTTQIIHVESPAEFDLDFIQPLLKNLIAHTDKCIQVANFVSAMATDAKSLENVENSCMCLTRLRAQMASLSLEAGEDPQQTVEELHQRCGQWQEESVQLQDAVSDIVDVREFTRVAMNEMISDRHGCDAAFKEQRYQMFHRHANNFISHVTQVVHSVKRHLNRSDDPIYRNGLLVLLKQVQMSQSGVAGSVRDLLADSTLNVEVYPSFTDEVSTAIQRVKVLRAGLDGHQHPHLLSPLREEAREPFRTQDTDELHLDHKVGGIDSPAPKVSDRDCENKHEESSLAETIDAMPTHIYDSLDLKVPPVGAEAKPVHRPHDLDLLPLLHEVLTLIKGKDVTVLNKACTAVLELSNSYVQAAKEASSVMDAIDYQTLESFRAMLVSLTPMLVQTAQETAMSSALSTESIYRHSAQFSDLIHNMRKVLLPAAGAWYQAVNTMLHSNEPRWAEAVVTQLSEVMCLSADHVQLLTSSDLTPQSDCKESFTVLHNKLNKAQNSTRRLAELCSSLDGPVERLEGPCVLWALSMHVLINSLDQILETSGAVGLLSTQNKLSMLSENSLRLQEAARLTGLNCKSTYKAKQLKDFQEELKSLTATYLQVAEDSSLTPSLLQLAKSEFLQRNLLIKMRVLCGHLSKANKDYVNAVKNIVDVAYLAIRHVGDEKIAEDVEQQFENAAQVISERVKSATEQVEDCLHYVRDPRSRWNLRSINDHLSLQISDIVSRARLLVETRVLCNALSLEVQIHCWSAKARHVSEEVLKLDGIQPTAKDHIRVCLQGREVHAAVSPGDAREDKFPFNTFTSRTKGGEGVDAGGTKSSEFEAPRQSGSLKRQDSSRFTVCMDDSSLTSTSLFLKKESESWDPRDNRIVQVTRKMAEKIYYMTQYLRRKGPIPNKEAFVSTAKAVASDCQAITQFVSFIAAHCLDESCTAELSLIVEQILTVSNQLCILSSVNAVMPGCKSSDEILVKNAQNLLKTVLRGVHAAETACIKGLRQPKPQSAAAEAAALCFQWRRRLQIHRAQQKSSPEMDELGLRRTASHPRTPSLALLHLQDSLRSAPSYHTLS